MTKREKKALEEKKTEIEIPIWKGNIIEEY